MEVTKPHYRKDDLYVQSEDTMNDYTNELPLAREETEVNLSKRPINPSFKPYHNQQEFIIFNVQELIPEIHVGDY